MADFETLPTFEEYCNTVTEIVTTNLLEGVTISTAEFVQLADDLKKELRQAYEDAGFPYGEGEENMVRYLMENTQIEIEGENEES